MSENATKKSPSEMVRDDYWNSLRMCPFCGSAGFVTAVPDRDGKGQHNGSWHSEVKCLDCPCATAAYGGESQDEAESRAITVWNERKYSFKEWNA